MDKIKKDLYQLKYAVVPVIIYLVVMQIIFGTVCPLKAFTGLDCPGCGLTHATIYLLAGNLRASIEANPTCLLWLLSIFLFFFDRYIHPLKIKPFPYLFIIVGLITLFWYFVFKIVLHIW